jgi:membrane protein DedA with SNARE-associated domain
MQQIAFGAEWYGLLIVFFNALLAQGGIPVPAFPILMVVAGAVASQSRHQIFQIIAAGSIGCMIADLVWYWGGKRFGSRIMRLVCKVSLSPDVCVHQTEMMFLKVGSWSLIFAKWLPALSTISVAMAGVTKMPLVLSSHLM